MQGIVEDTKYLLSILNSMIEDVNSTNSSNAKMEILGRYPECKRILNYIYDPMKMYGVTSKNVKKTETESKAVKLYKDIFILLDDLHNRKITGHTALFSVAQFVKNNEEYAETIYKIIDKDLKIGMGTSNINKVFPKLIPKFDVALANSYDKVKGKIDIEDYYGSHKLDGLRCIAIKTAGNVRFFSRQGKEFLTLDKVKEEILKICHFDDVVFDGELCLVDENGKEDFTAIMKVYKKKDYTIPNPKYKIFDMLSKYEFEEKISNRLFSERITKLEALIPNNNPILEVLEQIPMNEESFLKLQNEANEKGWEGIILRKDAPYKGKRSNDILKVKKFFDAEYVVDSIETGLFQVVEDGERKEIETLTAVHITHKGYDVKVGSGFSIDQRKLFYTNPHKIIGKTITVQYFEETSNEKGGISLRFPTLKHIYDERREV